MIQEEATAIHSPLGFDYVQGTPWILIAIELFAPNQLPSRYHGRLTLVPKRLYRLFWCMGQVPGGWSGPWGPSGLHGGGKGAKPNETKLLVFSLMPSRHRLRLCIYRPVFDKDPGRPRPVWPMRLEMAGL